MISRKEDGGWGEEVERGQHHHTHHSNANLIAPYWKHRPSTEHNSNLLGVNNRGSFLQPHHKYEDATKQELGVAPTGSTTYECSKM